MQRIVLVALVLAGLAGIGISTTSTRAAALVFVRTDGNNVTCNGTVNAPATSAPNCAFANIGWALDHVDAGGEVQVAPGNYVTGGIVIDQEVTLRGVPGGAKPHLLAAANPILTCASGQTCRFFDLVLDGNGMNNAIGINYNLFPASKGAVRRVDFVDFNVGQGTGVSVGGKVTVADNTFETTFYGVALHSAQASGSVIANNVYTGTNVFGSIGLWLFDATTGILTGNTVTGATRGIHVDQSYGTFTKNHLTGNGTGITGGTANFEAHGNQIAGNGTGISAASSTIDAENNWWGCNEGPGMPGCDTIVGATIDADPWLTMELVAPAFLTAPTGIAAEFNQNSDGAAVGADTLKNGTPVAFSAAPAARATLTSTSAPIRNGVARTRLKPAGSDGNVTVTSTLDTETDSAVVVVDTKAPVATLTSPDDGATISNLPNAKGTVNDPAPGSGVVQVLLAVRRELGGGDCRHWDGDEWVDQACGQRIWLSRAASGPNFTFPLPGSLAAFDVPGKYSIFVRGVDEAGNASPKFKFTRGENLVRFRIS